MNVVQTIEFLISAILYVLNINLLIEILGFFKSKCKMIYLLIIPYMASGFIMAFMRDGRMPLLYLLATAIFYFLLFIIVITKNSSTKLFTTYITLSFLSLDSIMQTLGCIFVQLFTENFNRDIVLKTSSLLFNILIFMITKYLFKHNKNQIRNSIRLLSNKIYILVLVSLVIIGELCGNMAIFNDVFLFHQHISNFLIIITILIFIAIIICLIFNSISKNYYENISKIMEKQVSEQVKYYRKIDKLNQDLREFRHDYKNHMICFQALLENGEYNDALEYIKEITNQDIIETHNFFSGNQIADAIFSDKNEYAVKNNIEIKFEGFISDEIAASDLCIILSNALDNAIEACMNNNFNETKVIEIKCAILQNVQIIRISNPNEKESTETTKPDKKNHGFGLYNIRKTVEKLNGQMHIPEKTPFFVLELEFNIKKIR